MAAPPPIEEPGQPEAPPVEVADEQDVGSGLRNLNFGRIPEGEIDSLPTMRLIEDRTAQLFAQELGHAFQAHIEVSIDEVKMEKWSEFIESGESPGCYNVVELEALGGHAIVSLEQNLFFGLLELLFGNDQGMGARFGPVSRVRFSSVEERVIRRVVHLFGRSMEVAWRPVIPMNVAHLRIESKHTNVNICSRDDHVIITRFAVKLPGQEGALSLIVPKSLLMGFRERLSTGRYEKTVQHKDSWRQAITDTLQTMRLQVVAELGKTELTLEQMLGLQVGQVLRLDTSPEDPVTVGVSGTPKYLGRATVHHGNLAIELESMIEKKK